MHDPAVERLLLAHAVAEFLHHEADLLDEGRFEEWLDLLDDDVAYVMPLRLNVRFDEQATRATTRPGDDVCWFDEGKDTLRRRVAQLRTGKHWAEEPVSRAVHLVANIRVVADDGADITVGSRFVVYRNRVADEADLFAGRRTDVLRRTGDGFRIRRREVLLEQNVLLAKNLTVLF